MVQIKKKAVGLVKETPDKKPGTKPGPKKADGYKIEKLTKKVTIMLNGKNVETFDFGPGKDSKTVNGAYMRAVRRLGELRRGGAEK